MTRRIPEPAWVCELHRFTNRNAGRASRLETGSLDFGVQSQQQGWPLRGIAYDPREHHLFITLGERASTEHLTHAIAGAQEIYLLIDTRGRDEALAIRKNDTNTLLRFIDL